MIVACQWKRSSPTGPAEQFAGGSRPRSCVDNGGHATVGGAAGEGGEALSRPMACPAHVSAVVQGRGDGVRGHRGPFFQKRVGNGPPGSAPIKASGRENSMPVSCICGAEPAAAIAGAPACLTPPPRA